MGVAGRMLLGVSLLFNKVILGLKNKRVLDEGHPCKLSGSLSLQFLRSPVGKDMGLAQLGFRRKILLHSGSVYEAASQGSVSDQSLLGV